MFAQKISSIKLLNQKKGTKFARIGVFAQSDVAIPYILSKSGLIFMLSWKKYKTKIQAVEP
jgi:hypothetical protein